MVSLREVGNPVTVSLSVEWNSLLKMFQGLIRYLRSFCSCRKAWDSCRSCSTSGNACFSCHFSGMCPVCFCCSTTLHLEFRDFCHSKCRYQLEISRSLDSIYLTEKLYRIYMGSQTRFCKLSHTKKTEQCLHVRALLLMSASLQSDVRCLFPLDYTDQALLSVKQRSIKWKDTNLEIRKI